jgi:hypothetical protein
MPFFSIFTPTHNAKYLLRAAESLSAQTFKDFEWLILPNAGVELPDLEELPNCRLVHTKDPWLKTSVGLKKNVVLLLQAKSWWN